MSSKLPTTQPAGAFPEDSFKYSPLEHVRTLFVAFCQGLFAAAPRGAYNWDPNNELSEIYISNENPMHDETIGQRPAISVTRAPVQFYSLGLDDMLAYDFETGTKRKSVLVPGTAIINCCSRVELEAERIAWICGEELWLHREMLMAQGFFEIGRQPSFDAPSPAGSLIAGDSGTEWYVVAVSCPFQFYRTSQVSPLNKRIIQNIGLSITSRLRDVKRQMLRTGGHGGAPSYEGVDPPFSEEGQFPPSFFPGAPDVYGATAIAGSNAPELPRVPHPLNPAQTVIVRPHRPNQPGVRPASIGGRAIPIATPAVEQSCGNPQADAGTTRTVKV